MTAELTNSAMRRLVSSALLVLIACASPVGDPDANPSENAAASNTTVVSSATTKATTVSNMELVMSAGP